MWKAEEETLEVARYPERKSRRLVRLFPFAAPFRWTVLLQLTELTTSL